MNYQAAAEEFESQLNGMDVDESPQEMALAPAEGNVITKVCTTYQKVKPFLLLVNSLFFIPEKWKKVIRDFMGILDGVCPQT